MEVAALAKRLKDMGCGANPGVLNYAITSLVLRAMPTDRYSDMNAVVGVLECVKQEFYRRVVTPYEQRKIEGCGDVYVR